MAKINQIIAKIQKDITDLEDYAKQLQQNEPEAYQKEIGDITERLKDLNVQHMEHIIEVYKTQNPKKYKAKKDALDSKVEYLKQGGDPKTWSYASWLKVQSAKLEETVVKNTDPTPNEEVSKCEQCEFVAKNNAGLSAHTRSQHKE